MHEDTARAISDLFLRHSGEQNEILKRVRMDEPADEFVRIRDMVGRTMGSIYLDVLHPIFEEYPALRPDGLREGDDIRS